MLKQIKSLAARWPKTARLVVGAFAVVSFVNPAALFLGYKLHHAKNTYYHEGFDAGHMAAEERIEAAETDAKGWRLLTQYSLAADEAYREELVNETRRQTITNTLKALGCVDGGVQFLYPDVTAP